MDEFIGLLLRGEAEVSAYEGFGGEFAAKLFRDVDECFATEDADSGEVGFISTPGLLGSLIAECACRCDIVYERGVNQCVEPVRLREISVS